MAKIQNGEESMLRVSTGWVKHTNVTDKWICDSKYLTVT